MRKKKTKKKEKRKPSSNGRNRRGQFTKKNKAAVGRKDKPVDVKTKKLKETYINAITENDIKEIVKGQVSKAKEGDTTAAKEIFDRLWGRAKQEIDVEHSGSISFTEALSKATKGEKDE